MSYRDYNEKNNDGKIFKQIYPGMNLNPEKRDDVDKRFETEMEVYHRVNNYWTDKITPSFLCADTDTSIMIIAQ